jgi:hypothetical protein
MRELLERLAGPEYAMTLLWIIGGLILLALVLVIVRLVRSLTFGTFVAGGRNRKTRLAVMDAAAVDSHRRLVLVRRDDVEHLLLIGGPTDVVVEQDIRLHVQQRRPAHQADAVQDQAPLRAAERSRPTEVSQPAPQRSEPIRPAPVAQAAPAPQPQRAPERPTPQLVRPHAEPERAPNAPVLPPRPSLATYIPPAANAPSQPYPGSRAATPAKPPLPDNVDDALMNELQVGNGNGEVKNGEAKKPAKPELSLEDEMTKLLGELSSHKR